MSTKPVPSSCRATVAVVAGLLLYTTVGAAPESFSVQPFTAEYEVSWGGITIGNMERTLSFQADGRYRIESHARSSGLVAVLYKVRIEEISTGQIRDDILRTDHYEYRQQVGRKRQLFSAAFDWQQRRIEQLIDGRAVTLEFEPLTFDRLNYQVQIMHDVEVDGGNRRYIISERGKIKDFEFELVGAETVTTPFARLEAIKYQRGRDSDSRQTTLWCARSLNNLVVRAIYREKDGKVTEVILEDYQQTGS